MSVAQKIQRQVSRMAEGTTFGYAQLDIGPQESVAAAKAMERLIAKGVVRRVSSGVFYRPRATAFGVLLPNETELLKPYLFERGKRIAYVTGTSLYNRMGLTTQIPGTLRIASRDKRISISTGTVKARPVKSYVDVTEQNFQMLGLLDALKDLSHIPDLDMEAAIRNLSQRLTALPADDMKLLIRCSLSYPPRVRGLLGSLLESIGTPTGLAELKRSLNPLSHYDLGVQDLLPTAKDWNVT
jgi:hypothetical protein